MKAKKRIGRPAKWDTTPILHLFIVARKRGRICTHLKEISATCMSDARRKAFLMFTQFDVSVFAFDHWQEMVEDFEQEKKEKQRPKKNTTAGKLPPEPKPMTEAERIQARRTYDRLKADYLAGKPVECSDKLKKQFEAFRPRRPIVAVAADLESSHRTKPISQHKWRPLQSGMDIDRCLEIMEHEADIEQETA